MTDFAVLPPEVNSARMYSGAGSSPMLSAAASWDRLAATLGSAASSYQAVVSQLTGGSWRGPASASMAAAAQPYAQWMSATAAQASQAAGQARAAASAYESALAATVPPGVVQANQAQLQALLAHNVFGQNAGAIAANQAEYSQMWAQDAAAMHGYAASSAATTGSLSPFSPPVHTANPAAAAAQAAATTQAAASSPMQSMTNALGNLPNIVGPLQQIFDTNTFTGINGLSGTVATPILQSSGSSFLSEAIQLQVLPLYLAGGKLGMLVPTPPAATIAAQSATLSSASGGASSVGLTSSTGSGMSAGSGVSASVGEAAPIGKLSAPPSWGAAAPEVQLASAASPTTGPFFAAPPGSVTPAGFGGAPMAGGWAGGPVAGVVNAPRNGAAGERPVGSVTAVQQRLDGTKSRGNAEQDTQNTTAGLNDEEKDELERLREEMCNLAMECEAMAGMMRQGMR